MLWVLSGRTGIQGKGVIVQDLYMLAGSQATLKLVMQVLTFVEICLDRDVGTFPVHLEPSDLVRIPDIPDAASGTLCYLGVVDTSDLKAHKHRSYSADVSCPIRAKEELTKYASDRVTQNRIVFQTGRDRDLATQLTILRGIELWVHDIK